MERTDLENIVKLVADEHLVAYLMEVEASDIYLESLDRDELIDVSYFGRRGISQMNSEELQKLVVAHLMDYYEGEDVSGEDVSTLIDENVRAGRALVQEVVKQREERDKMSKS